MNEQVAAPMVCFLEACHDWSMVAVIMLVTRLFQGPSFPIKSTAAATTCGFSVTAGRAIRPNNSSRHDAPSIRVAAF